MNYDNLTDKVRHAAEAAAQLIFEQIKTAGAEFICVDNGFYYVWYQGRQLLDVGDQRTFKKFLVAHNYLKRQTKHKGLVLERLDYWLTYNCRRFETTDHRIDGLAVPVRNEFTTRRPTKKTFKWVQQILQNGYYILKGNENDHD